MKPPLQPPARQNHQLLPAIFSGLFGAFLGLSLLKFGNPPVMEKFVSPPAEIYEFVLGTPWPIAWAYRLLGLVAVVGLFNARRRLAWPGWLAILPPGWLLWQIVAGTQSVDAVLTMATLKHFVACVICFYLGFFSLSRVPRLWPFWLGLVSGFLLVLAVGWEQHFGGLEETRRYFFMYLYPKMKVVPPEYLKKISSNRIFSTLFYPNALAGSLLLLLPATLVLVWQMRQRLTRSARVFLTALIAIAALGCLYWSGSKAGWLLMLVLGLVALLRLPFGKRLKVVLVAAVLLTGLTGFFLRYAAFFAKGATSVSARFDYWQAAWETTCSQPIFGTGPGTFAIPYERIKRADAEPARLVHNDYLEQASDSGLPGFVLYSVFTVGALIWGYPRARRAGAHSTPCHHDRIPPAPLSRPPIPRRSPPKAGPCPPSSGSVPDHVGGESGEEPPHDWLAFSLWLGVLGYSLQGLVEFSLYIPALAWSNFGLMGLLLATVKKRARS